MRKWILFGGLMLGLVQLEWGMERWAARTAPTSTGPARVMSLDSPWPVPTPVPTPGN